MFTDGKTCDLLHISYKDNGKRCFFSVINTKQYLEGRHFKDAFFNLFEVGALNKI